MNQELRNLQWVEELLPSEIVPKRMLGGVGYYLDEKLVLILVEASKTSEHKGITYPFEIWNGCLIPVEKMKQNTVWSKFTFLENHPAKKDCLYLPADSQDFEDEIKTIIREIKKRNPLFGTFVKISKASSIMDDPPPAENKPSLFNTGPTVKKAKPAKVAKKKAKVSKKSENDLLLSVLKRSRT